MDWAGQNGQDLADMWNAGRSASEVAAAFGIKRCSVGGVVARLRERGLIMRDRPHPTPVWKESEVERLKVLWADGKSCAQVADELGRSFSGVKGKIDRLTAIGEFDRGARKSGPKFVTVGYRRSTDEHRESLRKSGLSAMARIEAEMPGTGFLITELKRSQCRFPSGGTQPQWLFCGEPVVAGSYCPKCSARAYQRFASHNDQVRAA